MRNLKRGSGLGRAILALIAAIIAVVAHGSAALAAEGYWRFTGYTTTPPQSQLDETDRGMRQMGRVSETRVTGAFQAAESGAGTVDLFFKNDDIDRRLYLTTLKFSFTTGVEMRILKPGQKLRLNSTMEMGGNALSKAMPASGTGGISVDNSDYLVGLSGAIDQPASGSGELIVPNGGDTLTLHVMGHLGAYGGLTGTMHINYVWVPGAAPQLAAQPAPAPAPPPPPAIPPRGRSSDGLGSRLDVNELNGLWIGVWTRRPGTSVWDAVWHSSQYPEVRDVIRLESIRGSKIVFKRDGNRGRYFGTFSADRKTISGVASWYSSGMTWSARVGDR